MTRCPVRPAVHAAPRAAYRGRSVHRWASPGLTLAEDEYEASLALPMHTHDCASLVTVLAGRYVEAAEGRTYDVGPHAVLFQPAGAPHRDVFSARGARCFRIEIAPDWLARLGPAATAAADPLHLVPGPVAPNTRALYREFRRPDDLSQLAVESLLSGFFVEAARRRRRGGTRASTARPPWLDLIVAALHDRLRDPPTLAQLGELAGAHPGHVARRFRQHLGVSVGGYVRAARVSVARERLVQTTDPLARVAVAAGFCDQSHLARLFRRHVGVSPAAYRRGVRGDVASAAWDGTSSIDAVDRSRGAL